MNETQKRKGEKYLTGKINRGKAREQVRRSRAKVLEKKRRSRMTKTEGLMDVLINLCRKKITK